MALDVGNGACAACGGDAGQVPYAHWIAFYDPRGRYRPVAKLLCARCCDGFASDRERRTFLEGRFHDDLRRSLRLGAADSLAAL